MVVKKNTFENAVNKELDLVWKTYLHTSVGIKVQGVRRERRPKLIHIYGGKSFFDTLEKTLDCNPLMRIILDTIGKPELRYYPIYSRTNTGYRRPNVKSTWTVGTYYDKLNRVRDYEDNKIELNLDRVVGGYPPILTWLFVNRPTDSKHGDLLIYYINTRYANKEKYSSETIKGGSEKKSTGSSKEYSTANSINLQSSTVNESNASTKYDAEIPKQYEAKSLYEE